MKHDAIFVAASSFLVASFLSMCPPAPLIAAPPRLSEYITTHYTATGGDGEFYGEEETGSFELYGRDADREWMNLEKDGYPFDDDLRPAYNDYHNQITVSTGVKVLYDENENPLNDEDGDGIPDEIEEYEAAAFAATGFHCDILNRTQEVIQGIGNIQIVNNIIAGNSLFTVFLPPYYSKNRSYGVILAGQGYGSDNNRMYTSCHTQDAEIAGWSVLFGGKGVIVIRSNCGGTEAVGIHPGAFRSVGGFMKVLSDYGGDPDRVITRGASRAGNTALVWGANPLGYGYDVRAIHAFVPAVRFGSMGMPSVATFPGLGDCANKILGSENAYSYYYEDQGQEPPRILSREEKAGAAARVLLGVYDIEEADDRSAYGYFSRPDLVESLREMRILITEGTHESLMPLPFFLDFDDLLTSEGIFHSTVIGYCLGHGFYDATDDSYLTIARLALGEEIVPFTSNERAFFMPEKLLHTGSETLRLGFVRITDDLIHLIRTTKGYEEYFPQGYNVTDLAFTATIPYRVGYGLPITITLSGKEGKSWEIRCRNEDGYKHRYLCSGVFGESIQHPHEFEYGREYVILDFPAALPPGTYDWFFTYDGREIPNKFTPYLHPPQEPDFPDGVPAKAITIVEPQEPPLFMYHHPGAESEGSPNFGVDEYHPLLLATGGNTFPVLESIDDVVASAGDTIHLSLSAADSDGDELVYDLRDEYGDLLDFVGLQFNGLSGELTWTTTEEDVGIYTVRALANDGRGGRAEQAFTIEIRDAT